jgi:hypothetical protein
MFSQQCRLPYQPLYCVSLTYLIGGCRGAGRTSCTVLGVCCSREHACMHPLRQWVLAIDALLHCKSIAIAGIAQRSRVVSYGDGRRYVGMLSHEVLLCGAVVVQLVHGTTAQTYLYHYHRFQSPPKFIVLLLSAKLLSTFSRPQPSHTHQPSFPSKHHTIHISHIPLNPLKTHIPHTTHIPLNPLTSHIALDPSTPSQLTFPSQPTSPSTASQPTLL